MRVTEVTVVAKYSLDTGHGWKAIEVGATATLTNSDETLESVSAELYQRLTKQLKVLWANKANGEETKTETETGSPNPNWCAEHHTEFKQFSKNGNSWFSHKTADGTWHNRGS
jgi:hypothetical protein